METFAWHDVTIAFRDEGHGPAILFLHNGGSSSIIWRDQIEALSPDHRTVAIDLPGFGESPRPDHPADLATLVNVTAALLDHLGIDHALVVGNCMGSNIAAQLAMSRPDLVERLVLVNPLTAATFSSGWLGLLHRTKRIAPWPTRMTRKVLRWIVPPKPAAVMAVRFQVGKKGASRKLHRDADLVGLNRRSDQMPALMDVLDDMDAYGGLDHLTGLDVPTTTVWGASNRVLSPRVGAALGSRLAVDEAVVVPGCGHLPMLEDPDAVTEVIRQALRSDPKLTTAAESRS